MHNFPLYDHYQPAREARIITPERAGCLHRFFDTSPFSPSGRYVALFHVGFEDRLNRPGEEGTIVIVDLESGETREVARTAGWEFQMGANLQWGSDDETLLYTDVSQSDWEPYGVRLNWKTGERTVFERGIYHASPDGTLAAVTNPVTMRRTQNGYGVVIPDELVPTLPGLSEETGLWISDTDSRKTDLVVPVRKLVLDGVPKEEHDEYAAMENYPFHCKWNHAGDRLIVTLRRKPTGHPDPFAVGDHKTLWLDVFTCRPDGKEIHRAVPWSEWKQGGHHINFFPDGGRLSMNMNLNGTGMVLMQVNYDGSEYRPITEAVPGSGHPTVHPDGKHILTDTYVNELKGVRPDTVSEECNPIRWIDYASGTEETVAWIPTKTPHQKTDGALRVDPHPAWSRDWSKLLVNTYLNGSRHPLLITME